VITEENTYRHQGSRYDGQYGVELLIAIRVSWQTEANSKTCGHNYDSKHPFITNSGRCREI